MRSGGQGFSRHPDVLEVTDEATRRPESNPLSVSPPARPHVRLSDTPRTGRAAEDVGPYHPSCPERARRVASERARRAKYPRRPRRVASERVRRAKYPRRPRRVASERAWRAMCPRRPEVRKIFNFGLTVMGGKR